MPGFVAVSDRMHAAAAPLLAGEPGAPGAPIPGWPGGGAAAISPPHDDRTAWRDEGAAGALLLDGDLPYLRSRGASGVGNAVQCSADGATWTVTAHPSGAFPIYVAVRDGALFLASAQRPLGRALRAAPDPHGMVQFLRHGFQLGATTFFDGVLRLQPGQRLRFRADTGAWAVDETSTLWQGDAAHDGAAAIAELAQRLPRQLHTAAPGHAGGALMLSGGWDSRTLLGAWRAAPGAAMPACFSHGDTASRELRLARALAATAGSRFHAEPIDGDAFGWDRLVACFAACGTTLFPHWHRAGELLAREGAAFVASGVYGEVLGGHYGPAMVQQGSVRRALTVFRGLVGSPGADPVLTPPVRARIAALFRTAADYRPPLLSAAAWSAIDDPVAALDAAAERELARLERRGVRSAGALVEAFVSEQRGAQMICAQPLAQRGALPVALPFADRELLALAGRVPLARKIHNRVNRELLARWFPALLDLPMGATLVAARRPLLVQEASRAARAAWQRLQPRRLSWVNFEFVRDGAVLGAVADGLVGAWWDRDALAAYVRSAASPDRDPHALTDYLMRVVTVDLMLR